MKTKKRIPDTTRLRSAIRKVWLWSDVHKNAKARARVARGVYQCEGCQELTGAQDVHVDHIEPFTPIEGFNSLRDWGPGLERMFDLDNHQVLCKPCHSEKTRRENLARKKLNTGNR